MVTRLISGNRCYIMPKRGPLQSRTEGRPLALIDDPMSSEMIEQVANEEAAAFCRGYDTYMLKPVEEKDIQEQKRNRRESYGAGGAASAGKAAPPPPPAASPAPPSGAGLSAAEQAALVPELTGPRVQGDGIFGGAAVPPGPVANIPLEQRKPRCHNIVLDCPNMVGQVQSCFTWQNGRIWMDRQCKDPNTFVIRMTKPPGRILKVAQQETILCLKLHKEGKDC
uniref:Response regulatory domain-containing protein n=1 Tax=Romanomermis culicivorax TaxID=13658 RepID=A0A915ILE3_ROMCU